MFNFSLINLGCTKNLVDSQYLIGKILSYHTANVKEQINYIADPYAEEVEYVFLNTCGFLSSGRQEMMEVLQKLLDYNKKVYLLGCAVQYLKGERSEEVRRVKKLGELSYNYKNTGIAHQDSSYIDYQKEKEEFEKFLEDHAGQVFLLSWDDLDKVSVEKLKRGYNSKEFLDFVFPNSPRAYTDIFYGYEYLKIAEGCNNSCSFCIIPKIRGKQKSLPIEKVLAEAENLINSGAKELIIIAQDTTRYGLDLYGKPMLFEFFEKLDKLDGNFVYRVLYLYPDVVSLKQLEKLKNLEKFLPYFDIPLQHISSNVLKLMGRFYNTDYIYKFLDFIKNNFENAFIRTNFIIGFPGETENDFNQLIDFVKKDYFDNIALFQYHDEPLAASSKLPNKVGDKTLNQRFQIISKLVDDLLAKKNQKRKKQAQIGYIQDIIKFSDSNSLQTSSSDLKLIVRPYLHCPEIDPVDEISFGDVLGVFNQDGNLEIGDLIEYKLS